MRTAFLLEKLPAKQALGSLRWRREYDGKMDLIG
jgi:hypothetical protein